MGLSPLPSRFDCSSSSEPIGHSSWPPMDQDCTSHDARVQPPAPTYGLDEGAEGIMSGGLNGSIARSQILQEHLQRQFEEVSCPTLQSPLATSQARLRGITPSNRYSSIIPPVIANFASTHPLVTIASIGALGTTILFGAGALTARTLRRATQPSASVSAQLEAMRQRLVADMEVMRKENVRDLDKALRGFMASAADRSLRSAEVAPGSSASSADNVARRNFDESGIEHIVTRTLNGVAAKDDAMWDQSKDIMDSVRRLETVALGILDEVRLLRAPQATAGNAGHAHVNPTQEVMSMQELSEMVERFQAQARELNMEDELEDGGETTADTALAETSRPVSRDDPVASQEPNLQTTTDAELCTKPAVESEQSPKASTASSFPLGSVRPAERAPPDDAEGATEGHKRLGPQIHVDNSYLGIDSSGSWTVRICNLDSSNPQSRGWSTLEVLVIKRVAVSRDFDYGPGSRSTFVTDNRSYDLHHAPIFLNPNAELIILDGAVWQCDVIGKGGELVIRGRLGDA